MKRQDGDKVSGRTQAERCRSCGRNGARPAPAAGGDATRAGDATWVGDALPGDGGDLLRALGDLLLAEPYRSRLAELIRENLAAVSQASGEADALVDLHAAKRLTGLGKTAIYARVRRRFP